MSFSHLVATANADIFNSLGDQFVVGGVTIQALFDFEILETPAGEQSAPVLIVSPQDAQRIDKGADFYHNGIDYEVGNRGPNEDGMISLELKRVMSRA